MAMFARSFGLPLAILIASPLPAYAQESAPATTPVPPDMVRIVLKFVRRDAGPATEPVRMIQQSCPTCVQRDDTDFARQNSRETLVELDIPRGRYLEPAFAAGSRAFRRVLLETGDVPFRADGDHIAVSLPPLDHDAISAGEVASNIVGRGYILRFEHADPARRAGAYAAAVPAVERRAADALTFALREVVTQLGLGEQVEREELGVIEIMGFDTNDPHGHRDAPPHVHMHLRWPYNTGTQIGHFYLGPTGLLERTNVGITGYHLPERTFAPGQPFATLSAKGSVAFVETIDAAGGLRIATRDNRSCAIDPAGRGFDLGAIVTCGNAAPVTVLVADDLRGRLEVRSGKIREVFRYDPDNGVLLSPTASPPEPASAILPAYDLRPLDTATGQGK